MKMLVDYLSKSDLSIFHDYAVSCFAVDYDNHIVNIPVKKPPYTDSANTVFMTFNGLKKIVLQIDEDWGTGCYIYQIDIIQSDLESNQRTPLIETCLLLNSGDKIKIVCESILIEEQLNQS